MQKKVTLSLDEKTYKDFQKFCEENDIMLSKRVERLMSGHLIEKKGDALLGVPEKTRRNKK